MGYYCANFCKDNLHHFLFHLLEAKKKEIYICHDISFSSHHSIYADCTSDGKRNDKFVIKESIAASENNCQ